MLQKSLLLTSALGGARALTMRQNGCSFHLRTEGTVAAPVGQYPSGQTRVGQNETASSFTVTDGTFTDSQNRGCWWTPPTTVLQCDVGQIPEAGFSIACDGTVSHNGQTTFYTCNTGADGLHMIYLEPNGSQCSEITLLADGCYPSDCGGPANTTTSTSSSTGTLPLGGFTSSWQLTIPTGGGSSYPGNTGTAPPGSPTGASGTSTLPLGGFTSSWQLTFPTGGGGSYPGNTATSPGSSTGASNTLPLGGFTSSWDFSYPNGGGGTPTSGGGASTPTYPGGGGTPIYPGGESTATYPGGSTPANSESTPASSGSTLTYPVGSPPPGAGTPTYPGESTPTYPGESTVTYPGGGTSGESGPITPGETPPSSSYPGGSYPGSTPTGNYPPGGYPGGYPPGSYPPGGYPSSSSSTPPSGPSQTGTPGGCPGDLSGTYEYPHLIIPVDSSAPDSAPGTSYFGEVSPTISSAFNFDIPQSASGRTCNLVFYFPTQSQLETSSFNFTGSGAVDFQRLGSPVSESTSYANLPPAAESYGTQTLAPGNGYQITSFGCPAGQAVAFEMTAANGDNSTDFRYFQDYNPCPIGLYVTVS